MWLSAQETVRAILVTGASSGLGLRMTEVLAANGFFVYAGARSAEDMQRLDAMDNVKEVRLDVTVQSDRELVQLNGDHPFSYDRDTVVRMVDEALNRR